MTAKTELKSIIAERLTYLVRLNGNTQDKIAKKLCVSRPTLRNWLYGVSEPTATDLCRMAEYFDVSIDYLLGRGSSMGAHELVLRALVITKRVSHENI